MPWIKKNLTLVLGGLVGLILLGGSGFFLYSQYSRESAVNTSLEEKRNEWNRLNGLSPYPDEKNIKAVKDDAAKLDHLAAALKDSIRPVEFPHVNDTYSLKLLIETTIADLKKEADDAGVQLPNRYAFTFQRLRELPSFESNKVSRIAEQVEQIATICRVLYRAKVHTLDTLRRSPVLKDEGNSSDYLTKPPLTKDGITRAPFDFSFRAFSGELAEVLKGFAELHNCVVIKTVNIEPTTLPQSSPTPTPGLMQPMTPNPAMGPAGGPGLPGGMSPALAQRYGLTPGMNRPGEGGGSGGMDAAMRARYGLGPTGMDQMRSRYGGMGGGLQGPPPQALSQPTTPSPGGAPGAPATPSVVLDEEPLRVIFQIDFVKPAAPGDAAANAPKKAAARPAEADASAPADAGAGATSESETK